MFLQFFLRPIFLYQAMVSHYGSLQFLNYQYLSSFYNFSDFYGFQIRLSQFVFNTMLDCRGYYNLFFRVFLLVTPTVFVVPLRVPLLFRIFTDTTRYNSSPNITVSIRTGGLLAPWRALLFLWCQYLSGGYLGTPACAVSG